MDQLTNTRQDLWSKDLDKKKVLITLTYTHRVGINLPTVEVRFEHLTIQADCYIGNRALPTLANTARNMAESALSCLGIQLAEATKLTILKDASGMIKPSR
ncbi:hypothetical protein HYC85_028200 [Camellia sinensis]|uniref:Uncharacterized protein n=1 Tax=Camellia sinensis TaxID=4442 RepID=A0A7J7FUR4_CAMSI|nr:hypothetical protein HYC85_028200 [Camellia sinensis]